MQITAFAGLCGLINCCAKLYILDYICCMHKVMVPSLPVTGKKRKRRRGRGGRLLELNIVWENFSQPERLLHFSKQCAHRKTWDGKTGRDTRSYNSSVSKQLLFEPEHKQMWTSSLLVLIMALKTSLFFIVLKMFFPSEYYGIYMYIIHVSFCVILV